MTEYSWNKCSFCKVITDNNEKHCPSCGRDSLALVTLSSEEIKSLIEQGKVFTKNWADLVGEINNPC